MIEGCANLRWWVDELLSTGWNSSTFSSALRAHLPETEWELWVEYGLDKNGVRGTEIILRHGEFQDVECDDDHLMKAVTRAFLPNHVSSYVFNEWCRKAMKVVRAMAHPEELPLCVNIKFAAPVIRMWAMNPLNFPHDDTYNDNNLDHRD